PGCSIFPVSFRWVGPWGMVVSVASAQDRPDWVAVDHPDAGAGLRRWLAGVPGALPGGGGGSTQTSHHHRGERWEDRGWSLCAGRRQPDYGQPLAGARARAKRGTGG